jgi:hypothetical protein
LYFHRTLVKQRYRLLFSQLSLLALLFDLDTS